MMKKLILVSITVILILGSFIFSRRGITSIYGTIDPAESVSKVLAIKEKDRDTVVVVPHDGRFSIKVTAGTWKLYFVAVSPYEDEYAENIRVQDDRSTDVGIIRLTKKRD